MAGSKPTEQFPTPKIKYMAGWGLPGYLPKEGPCGFVNFDDAKQFILEELKAVEDNFWTGEEAEDHKKARETHQFAEDFNQMERIGTMDSPTGYEYWIKLVRPTDTGGE